MQGVRKSRRQARRAGSVLLVGFFYVAGVAAAQNDFRVEVQDGLVTLKAREVPLGELLEEISRQSGFVLELEGPCDEPTTVELTNLTVATALQAILNGRGYVYRRGRTASAAEGSHVFPPGTLWVFPTLSSDNEAGTAAVKPCPDSDLGPQPIKRSADCPGRIELALAHTDAGVRLAAVEELTEGGDAASVETLAGVARTDDAVAVREEAIYGLGEIGDPAGFPVLEQALIDPERRVRAAAIDAIADIGGEESAWALAVSLSDDDPSLREQTVYALEEIGGEAASVLLHQALADEHDSIREAVKEALEELTD